MNQIILYFVCGALGFELGYIFMYFALFQPSSKRKDELLKLLVSSYEREHALHEIISSRIGKSATSSIQIEELK